MSNTRNWPNLAAHSLTIGGKHTFRDWYMVPAEIPVFQPPEPKTTTMEIPGADGILDYTEVLTPGDVPMSNRKGSLNFIVLDDITWATAYSIVLNFLHGQKLNCILDDDPAFFYTGRFSVNKWKSNRHYNLIVIDYDLDPYKYAVDTTVSHDWLWDDLFNNTIYYGYFDVVDQKSRNLINPSSSPITPKFECSAIFSVIFNNNTYTLPVGTTTAPGFQLQPGNNNMVFGGYGRVSVDYSVGKQL